MIDQACDFTDIYDLATNPNHAFRLVSQDEAHRVYMHTKKVATSPIHMMKACAVMPCSPKDFLRYLDMDVRALWDDHFVEGVVVKEISATSRSTILTSTGGSAKHNARSSSPGVGASSSSSSINAPAHPPLSSSSTPPRPMRVKVQLKHIGFLSPIPLLANRDFELIIAEAITDNGVALLKAFSPPVGTVVPLRQGEYIRGIVSMSGFVAEPHVYSDRRPPHVAVSGCKITYIALVHPMGLIPPLVVNTVVGKQTAALVQLQDFIASNSLESLAARGLIDAAVSNSDGSGGPKCGVVMKRKRAHL